MKQLLFMKNRFTIICTLLLASLLVSGNALAAVVRGSVYGGGNLADVGGSVEVTIDGGEVIHDVYGGGALANTNINNATDYNTENESISSTVTNTTTVNLNGGIVNGDVYGGGLGDQNTAALVYGDVTVNVNGSKLVTGYDANNIVVAGRVFGANNINGTPKGDILVRMLKTAPVTNQPIDVISVFGGGNLAAYQPVNAKSTQVLIQKADNNDQLLIGSVFGGGNEANVEADANVTLISGVVKSGIYGGCYTQGTVTGAIEVNIEGNVGATGNGNSVDIFGGGYDALTATSGDITVNIGNTGTPVIYGDIYGGSALGSVNDAAADITEINILAGTLNGNIYGGGLGEAGSENVAKGQVNGTVIVNIGATDGAQVPTYSGAATINGSVYGCNNTNGSPKSNVFVNIYKTAHVKADSASYTVNDGVNGVPAFAIDQVFGGGNLADYTASDTYRATVHVYTCNNTIRRVFGGGDAAAAYGVVTVIDGGRFDYIFGGGNGESGAANIGAGGTNLTVNSGIINYLFGGGNVEGAITGPMLVAVNNTGCDEQINNFFAGGNLAVIGDSEHPVSLNTTIACGTNFDAVYGGSNLADIYGNVTLTINGGTIDEVYAGSKGRTATQSDTAKAANIYGSTTLNIYAGNIGSAFGGSNINGNISGAITVNMDWSQSDCDEKSITNIFGASNLATYAPTTPGNYPAVNIKHGTVGNVFGAGNGDPNDPTKGIVTSNPVVTIGDAVQGNYAVVTGNVYGGGNNAAVTGNTTVIYDDNNASSTVAKLFGGGNAAGVSGSATVTLSSGKVTGGIYGGCNSEGSVDGNIQVNIYANVGSTAIGDSVDIFGGGYGASTSTSGNVTVTIGDLNGTYTPVIYGDIYGGSALGNVNDAPSDTTTVNFLNGTLHGNLYGGGLGQITPSPIPAKVYGWVQVNIGEDGQNNCAIDLSEASIFGCNNTNGSPQDSVTVNIFCTGHNQNGKDQASYAGNDSTFAIYQVFGGGNRADYAPENGPASSTKKARVNIFGCLNTVERVFGGGNAAASVGVETTIYGGRFGYVFGGGNGEVSAADIGDGGTNLTVHGSKISHLFGGSNTSGNITGSMGVNIDNEGDCPANMYIAEFFCGNNLADVNSDITATIGCGTVFGDVYGGCNLANVTGDISLTIEGGTFDNVYGGSKGRLANTDPNNTSAKAANISGNVTLNIVGGNIGNAFGGSNINGNITGSIIVNVNKDADACTWSLGNVYGGSNLAAYTPENASGNYPEVNIQNGTINGNVYGGGKGTTATVTSNPKVTIGVPDSCVKILGDVYGGGDAAKVLGAPAVYVINNIKDTIGNVYGGGNAADVRDSTRVIIDGGIITGDVYGGGHGDSIALGGTLNVAANVGGNVRVSVTGGKINHLFGGANTNGSIGGTVSINVNKGANSGLMHISELYGGGNKAPGNAGTIRIISTGSGADEGIDYVYGGANQANILNDIALSITGGSIGNVFGGNNTSGTISGMIQVDVNWAASNVNRRDSLGNVFGGGNLAEYSGSPVVNIKNGTVSGNVYGGGNGDPNDNTQVKGSTLAPTVTIGDLTNDSYQAIVLGDVYGGGNAAKVTGSTAPTVLVQKNNTQVGNVYGGGNAADVPATSVTINAGTISGDVYGGGHGDKASLNVDENDHSHSDKTANVDGNVNVDVNGGTINRLFGGANTNGNITGSVTINVEKGNGNTYGDMHITELYGGGNMANGNAGTINIINTGSGATEGIDYVYGGANQADISNNIALSITGGSIGNVFGGNNTSGTISGTILVDVNWGDPNPNRRDSLGNVFGGGNLAVYSGRPVVNIKNGTVSGNVYGGGNGDPDSIISQRPGSTGAPTVTIGDLTDNSYQATVRGDVYGGGNAAKVTDSTAPTVLIQKCDTEVGNVYGGGNAADVPATYVTITGGTINDVYGGGHGDKASLGDNHSDKAANVTGNAYVLVKGGTIYRVFAASNTNGTITGTDSVIVNKDSSCDLHITELYGGSNMADGKAGVLTIKNTGDPNNNEDIDYVYGGSNAADVTNDILLNILEGSISNVFGGNNTSGSISGTITVNINQKNNPSVWNIGNVYGGGNQAPYSGSPAVNIINGTVTNNVFGGGLGSTANVAGTQVTLSGGTVGNDIFGGGQAAPVNGSTNVILAGGTVNNNLYGGGMEADVSGNTILNMNIGTIGNDVFGGGKEGDVYGNVTVNISNSQYSGTDTVITINGSVYGGGALAHTNKSNLLENDSVDQGIDRKKTIVNLYPGAKILEDVYGGALGNNTIAAIVYGDVEVTQYGAFLKATYSNEGLATTGRIFGCNNVNGTPKGHVTVYVVKTTGSGGQAKTPLADLGNHEANHTYQLAAVYGGGNQAEYLPFKAGMDNSDFTEVIIDGCNDVSIHYVYGGGNAASTPATKVEISGAYEIEYVFGGGNGAGAGNPGANVGYHYYDDQGQFGGITQEDVARRRDTENHLIYGTGIATTAIYGGRIHNVYGGSNTRGNVRETAVSMLDEVSPCPLVLDGIYGGGREAYMEGTTSLELGCISGMEEIYGGSEKADVGGNVELTITSGNFGKVYGGNNKGGRILGSIKVNIEQTGCLPITIDELYLGGNNAPYSVYGYLEDTVHVIIDGETVTHHKLIEEGADPLFDDPVMNIRSFDSIGTVYGGGNGSLARMIANPTVDINVTNGWVNGEYIGEGHDQYNNIPAMLERDGIIGTVYGGGNQAEVKGRTNVLIGDKLGDTITLKSMELLYNSVTDGEVRSDIRINKSTVEDMETITFTAVEKDDHSQAVQGKTPISVTIDQRVNGATIVGNVYGGGNNAAVTEGTNVQIGPTPPTP